MRYENRLVSGEKLRKAVADANRVASMLQGTMSLESQGLDRTTLHEIKQVTVRELLASN
jgi:hypothetical protein